MSLLLEREYNQASREFQRKEHPRTPIADENQPYQPTGDLSPSKQEITALVEHLLNLNEKKDLGSIMSHYADQVDYYDRGVVDRDYIRKDMGYYFRNWEKVRSTLDGNIVLIVTEQQNERIVKFVSSFSVRNSKKSITGKTENIWRVQKIGNQIRIAGVKQRVLYSEAQQITDIGVTTQ
jgi:hypothetical protein